MRLVGSFGLRLIGLIGNKLRFIDLLGEKSAVRVQALDDEQIVHLSLP